jgi:hypothetical protein
MRNPFYSKNLAHGYRKALYRQSLSYNQKQPNAVGAVVKDMKLNIQTRVAGKVVPIAMDLAKWL